MKKDIAIITLHSVNNYGSVLQAYATQCFFEEFGLNSIIIDYRRPWETCLGYWFYLNEKSIKGIARNIMYFPSKIVQRKRFQSFRKKYLKLSQETYTNSGELRNRPIKADYYCTGSDQVWNSGWNEGVISAFYLDFVDDKNAVKLSFAASFGNSELSNNEKSIIKPFLAEYSLITVRERQAEEMIRNGLGLEAFEILDPTLQMSGDFWKCMCSKRRIISNGYVLLIQLNRNRHFDKLALEFAKKHKLKLVRLCLRLDQIVLPGKCILIPNVLDYIRLIRDAEYILTDSFHAISFCLNLEKQFYVYYPNKYSERIKSILSVLNLFDRELCHITNEALINYDLVRDIISSKREYTRVKIENLLKSK